MLSWIPSAEIAPPGGLALSQMPGLSALGRSLDADLELFRAEGISLVVSLAEKREISATSSPQFFAVLAAHGLASLHFPIPDGGAPTDLDATAALARTLDVEIRSGKRVLLHCLAGLGRTGTVAACLFITRGATYHEALRIVREARSPRAVETPVQQAFVASFAMYWRQSQSPT